MTTLNNPDSSRSVETSLAAAAEDHALVSVPAVDRRSGFQLALSPVSVATALVIFAIAGFTVTLAGFVWGLVAGVAVGVLGFALGKLLGNMAYRTGLSGTVTSRFFGFGQRGSAVGSVVFAVMILGFLAVESALLYEGTLLMFEWEDTWATKIGVYGVLTLLWIALAIFGIKLALRAGAAMIVVTLLVTAYMIVQIYVVDGASVSAVFGFDGVVPGGGWTKFETAVSVIGATAGTIALVTADFARYARTDKDVTVLAAAGPLVQNVVMIVLGSLVVIGGMPEVVEYLMARDAGLTPEAAAAAGSGLVMGNTGAFFVIFAGWAGFVTIYAAQAKAQAINAYSGSLALVNLVDSLFGKKPGRAVMVVVGNVIALLMIAAGILDEFNTYLSYLGAMTLAMAGVMIADYYVVRRGSVDGSHRIEKWNWAGVTTLVVAAAIGIWLMEAEIVTLGFLVSLVVAVVGYPLLRSVLPEGTGTGFVAEAEALDEAL